MSTGFFWCWTDGCPNRDRARQFSNIPPCVFCGAEYRLSPPPEIHMSQDEKCVNQQLRVFQKSLSIYIERSEVRGELWAAFQTDDAIRQAKSKLARAEFTLKMLEDPDTESSLLKVALEEEALDSLYDLINFAAFAVRHITGAKPTVVIP